MAELFDKDTDTIRGTQFRVWATQRLKDYLVNIHRPVRHRSISM